MKDRWESQAEAEIERLKQDYPPEFFHALRQLIDQRFPRGKGRREGEYPVDDSARLEKLAELLRSGMDEKEAVQKVAGDDPGGSAKNTRKRLYRKLPDIKEKLARPSEIEKDEILTRAFEEPVETWGRATRRRRRRHRNTRRTSLRSSRVRRGATSGVDRGIRAAGISDRGSPARCGRWWTNSLEVRTPLEIRTTSSPGSSRWRRCWRAMDRQRAVSALPCPTSIVLADPSFRLD